MAVFAIVVVVVIGVVAVVVAGLISEVGAVVVVCNFWFPIWVGSALSHRFDYSN